MQGVASGSSHHQFPFSELNSNLGAIALGCDYALDDLPIREALHSKVIND